MEKMIGGGDLDFAESDLNQILNYLNPNLP